MTSFRAFFSLLLKYDMFFWYYLFINSWFAILLNYKLWHIQTIPQQWTIKCCFITILFFLFELIVYQNLVYTATKTIVCSSCWACCFKLNVLTNCSGLRHLSPPLWYRFVVPSYVSYFFSLHIDMFSRLICSFFRLLFQCTTILWAND